MWSWLFGNSKNTEKVVDGVSSGLDMMFFTDEEKSLASQKVLDFKIEYAKHTQSQSIARRVIAFIVAGIWGLLVLMAVALYFVSLDASNFVFSVIKDVVNPPFMLVTAFYFLAHVTGRFGKQ